MLSFNINHSKYTIKFSGNDLLDKYGNPVKSVIVYKDNLILIDNRIALQRQKHCLIHEICHAYIYETQIIPHNSYTEEHLCELMALYGEEIIRTTNRIMKEVKNEKNKKG